MWKAHVGAVNNTQKLLDKQHEWFVKKLQSQGRAASLK